MIIKILIKFKNNNIKKLNKKFFLYKNMKCIKILNNLFNIIKNYAIIKILILMHDLVEKLNLFNFYYI